jgi:hypothetical protein
MAMLEEAKGGVVILSELRICGHHMTRETDCADWHFPQRAWLEPIYHAKIIVGHLLHGLRRFNHVGQWFCPRCRIVWIGAPR